MERKNDEEANKRINGAILMTRIECLQNQWVCNSRIALVHLYRNLKACNLKSKRSGRRINNHNLRQTLVCRKEDRYKLD